MTKHQRSTKRDPSYWEYVDALHSVKNNNSSIKRATSSCEQPKPRRNMPMLDQFHPCMHDFIENIVDVKPNGNSGYLTIIVLLGMGEGSWSLVHNHFLKELAKWSDEYINLLGGIYRFEELKRLLLVDGLSLVYKFFCYVIASRYNVILVSLSLQQNMIFFPLRSQPPRDCFVHHAICIGHLYDNHFIQVNSWSSCLCNFCNKLCCDDLNVHVPM